MGERALPRGAGLGIERVEFFETQYARGIELVRVRAKPVERGHAERDVSLFGRRFGIGPDIGRSGRRIAQRRGQLGHLRFDVVLKQIAAEQRAHPQQKARRDRRAARIAPRAGEHDLRGTERTGKVVRGQPDTVVCPRHAQRA